MSAPAAGRRRSRAVGLFGGSFDPIHAGHLAVARAATRRFELDELHFIPSGRPPHPGKQELAPFAHRHAMVALACAGKESWIPSLAEAGEDFAGRAVHYTIDTVRRFRTRLRRSGDRLYFLTGADAFLEIPTWKSYEELLLLCDFVVAARPGFRMEALRLVIPPELLGRPGDRPDRRTIPLRRTAVHLLDRIANQVSSSEIRRRCREGRSIRGLVPPRVEEYIQKQALYT